MAQDAPLFSVVIPVYNRAHLIERAIRSVLDQHCQDFEIVVVDDGSTDDPASAIGKIGDPRIRVIRQDNAGGGAARNAGIDAARGRYIAFLDSDDLFLPHKLQRFAERMPIDPLTVGYSFINVDRGVGKYWIRPTRTIQPNEDVGEYLFVSNEFIPTPTLVLDREFATSVRFDPSLKKGQDLDFCLRLQRVGAKFFMIEEPLAIWCDIDEGGRTSRVAGYEANLAWLERARPLLTRKAALGYRATVLAYYLAKERPLTALKDLIVGWAIAGVPLRIVGRQALRAYLPRDTYRALVNWFVRVMGRSESISTLPINNADGRQK